MLRVVAVRVKFLDCFSRISIELSRDLPDYVIADGDINVTLFQLGDASPSDTGISNDYEARERCC